jgi:adenine-specific DNA-methyltransferase
MDIQEQSATNNITAQKDTHTVLRAHFSHCFDKNGAFDFEKFRGELEKKELEMSQESYGMSWLGKSYARLLASDPATTLLKEQTAWNAQPENSTSENLLLKGDNLEVLKHLSHAYHEQVKMIYIDPPYNTGSDGFVYADDRKFETKEFAELAGVEEEKAKRILSFVSSKSNSHSAWLTFMYPRLYIARQLLRDDGVIFVSIDDNEVAQLRILMDEIFGEENFVANFTWIKKEKTSGVPPKRMVLPNKEYVLVFGKNAENIRFKGQERSLASYKQDKDGRWWRTMPIQATGNQKTSFTIIDPKTGNKYPGRWAFSEKKILEMIEHGKIAFPKNGKGLPIQIVYADEMSNQTSPIFEHLGMFDSEVATKSVKSMFDGNFPFDFPKPVELIEFLVDQGTEESDLILDFFAGSGTTGDAVMQLNAEDSGNRKYILVQLPEPIDPKKNKTAYDFVHSELGVAEPTIFDITRERLVRAAKKAGDTSGFKIFETVPIWEDYEFHAEEFEPTQLALIQKDLSEEDLQILLTTWKTFDGIPLTTRMRTKDLGGYTAYYGENREGKGTLYLMHAGFTAEHLKALLTISETDPTCNPASVVACASHFESARLRELVESTTHYPHRKKLETDFVMRY